jgi:hypothetical protein
MVVMCSNEAGAGQVSRGTRGCMLAFIGAACAQLRRARCWLEFALGHAARPSQLHAVALAHLQLVAEGSEEAVAVCRDLLHSQAKRSELCCKIILVCRALGFLRVVTVRRFVT